MYTYGPVPSRRLGRSLGVSPIPPKTCSYSCVYCQLGRTNRKQITRESFYQKEDILAEIAQLMEVSSPDYITFVGDGEPTLCKDISWLIGQCKEKWTIPVAVITNGSLLFLEDVRHDLKKADVVLPTLDAGNEKTFKTINKPHGHIKYDAMLQGLVDFRSGYSGQIWLEVMLVKGLNDTEDELLNIRQAVDMIHPDRVYVVIPIRPPAESWVKPPDPSTILKAQQILGEAIPLAGLESGQFGLQEFSDARQAIMGIASRHPLRREQAADIEKTFSAPETVKQMLRDKEIVEVEYNGNKYLLPGYFIRG